MVSGGGGGDDDGSGHTPTVRLFAFSAAAAACTKVVALLGMEYYCHQSTLFGDAGGCLCFPLLLLLDKRSAVLCKREEGRGLAQLNRGTSNAL